MWTGGQYNNTQDVWHWPNTSSSWFPWNNGYPRTSNDMSLDRIWFRDGKYIEDVSQYELAIPLCEDTENHIEDGR